MEITKKDPFTGQFNTFDLDITAEQIYAWRSGVYAQDAFPQLNEDEREFLISGIPIGKFDEYCPPGIDE